MQNEIVSTLAQHRKKLSLFYGFSHLSQCFSIYHLMLCSVGCWELTGWVQILARPSALLLGAWVLGTNFNLLCLCAVGGVQQRNRQLRTNSRRLGGHQDLEGRRDRLQGTGACSLSHWSSLKKCKFKSRIIRISRWRLQSIPPQVWGPFWAWVLPLHCPNAHQFSPFGEWEFCSGN